MAGSGSQQSPAEDIAWYGGIEAAVEEGQRVHARDDRDYHRSRAETELMMAEQAKSAASARLHLRLHRLHAERSRG